MNKFIRCFVVSSIFILKSFGGGSDTESSSSIPLEDQILEKIYTLCGQKEDKETFPFSLAYDLKELPSNLSLLINCFKPHLNTWKTSFGEEIALRMFIEVLNTIFSKDLKISHFYIKEKSLETSMVYSINSDLPKQSTIEKDYVKLTLSDFNKTFNGNDIEATLEDAIKYQKGVIIDLKNNPGGFTICLNYLYSFFFNHDTIVNYIINTSHQPFLGYLQNWIGDFSKANMIKLVETIQSNWRKEGAPWEKFRHFRENKPIIQSKIAILINENSASCAEMFTLALKDHGCDRVKIIGKKSNGSVIIANMIDLPLNFVLQYPIGEVLGVHGERVEGVGITPDFISDNEEEIMAEAIKWVTQ